MPGLSLPVLLLTESRSAWIGAVAGLGVLLLLLAGRRSLGRMILTGAAFALIVIPSYFLQLGVARASPLAVNVFRALGPAFVFAAQQFDGRVRYSESTLACVVAFVLFTVMASLPRGLSELRASQSEAVGVLEFL